MIKEIFPFFHIKLELGPIIIKILRHSFPKMSGLNMPSQSQVAIVDRRRGILDQRIKMKELALSF